MLTSSLLPRFLQPGGLQRTTRRPLSSTAYLDALRGWAAIIVVNFHLMWKSPILQWPFISLIKEGRLMVDIFFIISGFALSRKMLKMTRQSDPDLLQYFASSIFRRYVRLYLPTWFGGFISYVCITTGLILSPAVARTSPGVQFLDYLKDMLHLGNPFSDVVGFWTLYCPNSRYHFFLWTIPVEFRGSLVVYLFCVMCCKMKVPQRTFMCWALIAVGYLFGAVYISLFMFGVFLAERSVTRELEGDSESIPSPTGPRKKKPSIQGNDDRDGTYERILSGGLIILGIYLASQPEDLGINGPAPWPLLSKAIPTWWPDQQEFREQFWLGISAACMLFGLEGCTWYQKPFNTPFSQYVGQLSFGIYIMHLPVGFFIPMNKIFQAMRVALLPTLGHIVSAVILAVQIFFTLWTADYFVRVDQRIVALSRRLEQIMFTKV